MKEIINRTLSGVSAGILISLGGSVFLACENRYIGALLFCVALVCICCKGYSLFTGKVGYIFEKHGKEDFSVLLLGLLGNLAGTFVGGRAVRYAFSSYAEKALEMCEAKMTQSFWETLIRAAFCGVLMYLAVSIFKERDSALGIIFCIPVFILSGFEHSIADMFYFAASGIVSVEALGFLWTVILGNSLGALLLPILNFADKGRAAGSVGERKRKKHKK